MEQNYHYYAFISYSTTDSKWAKWLQHQLSYYHIPSSIKKSKIGVPNKIRPIFIYEYDLAGNQLHTAIQQELEASKYLIVICSPNAAKSRYVNNEVESFIRMGRSEYIIPFVVDGEVNSTDSDRECFPPALLGLLHSGEKENELRGVNVSTNGKRQALVDIVATMLGVRRDVLWNRYKIRQMKQRMMMAAIAVFSLLCGLLYWDYTRPTYKYYADYVDVWGVPTGILGLDKREVKHRHGSYRFEYRRIPIGQPDAYSWRLTKVSHINSAGTATPIPETAHRDRYSIQQLTYSSDNGTLTSITYCDEKGKPQIIHNLSRHSDTPAAIVDIESVVAGDGIAFAKSISAIDLDNANKTSNITRYAYERNAEGYITRMTFHANNSRDFNSSAVADSFGVWGMAYELDSLGRRLTVHYLNKDGSRHCNKIGISARHYEYNPMGGVCSERTVDLGGNPILSEFLCSMSVAVFDDYGNYTEVCYFDSNGKPCLIKNGFAKWIVRYDERGNQIEQSFYDINGRPCLNNDGFAKFTAKYKNGNPIEQAFYGIDNEPCLCNNGFAKCRIKFENNNPTEWSYYGINGKPCLCKGGYAKTTAKFEDGNQIEGALYGINGKPCLCKDGFAKFTAKYDEHGNQIEQSYYDINGKPCLCKGGFAKGTAIYENGNRIEEAYYDVNGKPCLCDNGFAKTMAIYEDGNPVEFTFYGVKGEPCLCKDSVAKWTAKYDDRGNRIETANYGIDGKPCLCKDGFSKAIAKFDDHGNQIEWTLHDINGKPCLSSNGFAKGTARFDDRGNRIEETYYGVDGKPCLCNYGFAKASAKFDDRGNQMEATFYGVNGKPCLCKDGYAKGATKFDDRGNRIEEVYYGVDGKPCLCNYGYATAILKYDDRGNWIETTFYGVDGKPCLCKDGFAKITAKFDDRGNQIEWVYYGIDGELCMSNYGVAAWISRYDDLGNCIMAFAYDAEGNDITEKIINQNQQSHVF